MSLHVKYVMPKGGLSPKSLRGRLLNAVKWTNATQIQLINQYLKTWNHRSEIDVTNRYGYKGGDAFAEIYITDHHRNAFWYVELGTETRHAVMTDDFRPKTKARTIQSGSGAGGLKFVNKKVNRPGIKGRHVLEEINKVTGRPLLTKITRIIGDINIFKP